MATAYAALVSVMNTIELIQEHPRPPIQFDQTQVDSLKSKIRFLQEFLEVHHNNIDHGLEIRIADATYAAEDLIESRVRDNQLADQEDMKISSTNDTFQSSLKRVIEDSEDLSIIEQGQVNELRPRKRPRLLTSISSSSWSSSSLSSSTYAAEDLIESRVRDNQLPDQEDMKISSTNDSFQSSLQRVIEDLDALIKKEVTEVKDNYEQSQGNKLLPRQHHPVLLTSSSSLSSSSSSSSKPPTPKASGDDIVIGIEDVLIEIKEKLTQQHDSCSPQIISISGMGGIGKTTLALKVYDDSFVKYYFDLLAWATISKDYNTHESLVELVHCLNKTSKESLSQQSDHKLGLQIHQCLSGRRYLVVLDDVWEVEAWEKIRTFFPASKGSGIVITTRESKVASISSHNFGMNLLDEDKSWNLFCQKVFGQDSCCPLELEAVGKKISNNCRGLPLSIAVIGGHLAKSPRTQEYWQYIAENLSSVVNSEDNEHCLKVLSLSYAHLPIHLKPCFLYMGIFPEDQEIKVPQLIRLWVAEGFLKPIVRKNLEETAAEYLNDLVGRNLIIPVDSDLMGKLESCKIHDLLRDLCVKEAMEKNFHYIVQKQCLGGVSNNERRIIVHESASDVEYPAVLKSLALLRTLIIHGTLPSIENNKLLRVLAPTFKKGLYISLDTIVEVTQQLFSLRCLKFTMGFVIPPSICLLWNLQFLHIDNAGNIKAPLEIWKMPHLREIYVHFGTMVLPHPGPIEDDNSDILKSLHTVETISNFSFCEEVVNRISNIKKLKVVYDDKREGFDEGAYTLNNVAHLEKLETFYCSLSLVRSIIARRDMLRDLNLPLSLKKLTFNYLQWEDVTTKIGSLPLLEVLDLWNISGSEWELVEGQFSQLRILKLGSCIDLEYFIADENHFPRLQELELNSMDGLKEISSDIGDIPTLKLINLRSCPYSAVLCAKRIAEEQYELGNEQLQVKVELYRRKPSGLTEEESTLLSSSAPNFHIDFRWISSPPLCTCVCVPVLGMNYFPFQINYKHTPTTPKMYGIIHN